MRLASFRIVPYRLPLGRPFMWRGGEVAERDGLLLQLVDVDGRTGWGDAAPLPGFSRDSSEEARGALDAALPRLVGLTIDPRDAGRADSPLHLELDAFGLALSARYAVDLALLEMAASAEGEDVPKLLNPDPAAVVPVAALVDGPPEGVVEEAGRRVLDGYVAIKLKLGRLDPESDAEVVRDVRRRVGSGVELRVDANRAWTTDQAEVFAGRVADAGVAYVEEPLASSYANDLRAFAVESRLRIALDETLAIDADAELGSWLAAVVLKPTVLGGVAAVMRIAERARRAGVRVVLSAAFESGVGQRGVAVLASATGAEPAGLDPYSRLAEDVVEPRLPFDRPLVTVAGLFSGAHQVRDPAADASVDA